MDSISDEFKNGLVLIGLSILIVGSAAGIHNIITPDQPARVGFTEIDTTCAGINLGVCVGIQRQQHTTYNYDNYTAIEEGTPNYYRKVESELMAQAYNICESDISGYEWASEASYDGQTGAEWRENENVELLPCEQTFYRKLNATR